jgi:hypothetical protein
MEEKELYLCLLNVKLYEIIIFKKYNSLEFYGTKKIWELITMKYQQEKQPPMKDFPSLVEGNSLILQPSGNP